VQPRPAPRRRIFPPRSKPMSAPTGAGALLAPTIRLPAGSIGFTQIAGSSASSPTASVAAAGRTSARSLVHPPQAAKNTKNHKETDAPTKKILMTPPPLSVRDNTDLVVPLVSSPL